jgi:PAS domain-containing protein
MAFAPFRGRLARQREDQAVLHAMLECAELAVVACGADGRLSHASRRARELFDSRCEAGLAPERWIRALRPRTASGVAMPFEDLPPVRALQGEILRGVEVMVTIAGRDRLLNTAARPVEDDRGRRRGAVMVFEDVTRQRRWEAQLRQGLSLQDDAWARREEER